MSSTPNPSEAERIADMLPAPESNAISADEWRASLIGYLENEDIDWLDEFLDEYGDHVDEAVKQALLKLSHLKEQNAELLEACKAAREWMVSGIERETDLVSPMLLSAWKDELARFDAAIARAEHGEAEQRKAGQ